MQHQAHQNYRDVADSSSTPVQDTALFQDQCDINAAPFQVFRLCLSMVCEVAHTLYNNQHLPQLGGNKIPILNFLEGPRVHSCSRDCMQTNNAFLLVKAAWQACLLDVGGQTAHDFIC